METKSVKITKQELKELLSGLSGATPASLLVVTEKTIKGIGAVTKLSNVHVFLNARYQNSMNKSLAKDGFAPDFQSSPRIWGERIPNTPLVTYNGRWYIEAQIKKDLGHVLIDKLGKILDQKDKPSDARVTVRDYSIENVKEIVINKDKFEII